MAMRVDAARHHQQPIGLDPAGAFQIQPDRGNAVAVDANVAAEHVGGGDNRSAGDDQIVVRHGCDPFQT